MTRMCLTDRARNPRNFAELDGWQAPDDEPILDPDLPIVDAHHHLWDRSIGRFMFEELLAEMNGGHDIRATVYVECDEMLKADGPEDYRVVGETEFACGIAAITASGRYGSRRACAGIVGAADLAAGSTVKGVLEAHIGAGGGRFRGIRHRAAVEPSLDWRPSRARAGLLRDAGFREGFACLEPLGLSFDAWLFHTQTNDLLSLADDFRHTTIVLNHAGGLLGVGAYEGRLDEMFPIWRDQIGEIARRDNIVCKIGGFGMVANGFPFMLADHAPSSAELSDAWKPYLDHCIEQFGPQRCIAESNFPPDRQTCSYRVIWNAYKLATRGYSLSERRALFHDNAVRIYRLDLPANA
jgi:predicted TIM-barrel fold metal-dependent hydrolase